MKDAIGQEIVVGDRVFHSGARGIKSGVYDVVGLTAKMVQVVKPNHIKNRNRYTRDADTRVKNAKVLWRPEVLVNVTSNLQGLQ